MKKKYRTVISVIVSLMICFANVQIPVFATEEAEQSEEEIQETAVQVDEETAEETENTVSEDDNLPEETAGTLPEEKIYAGEEIVSETAIEPEETSDENVIEEKETDEASLPEKAGEEPALEFGGDTDGFQYNHNDEGTITIIGYIGSNPDAVIPSMIDGKIVEIIISTAFQNNKTITSVTIPATVKTIDEYAFQGCTNLKTVRMQCDISALPRGLFNECSGLTDVEFPENLTEIGPNAFRNCSSLVSLALPETVATIGNAAFSGCSSLKSVSIPDGVTAIETGTFYNCSSLEEITIPEKVASIGSAAFSGCASLKSISIPNSVLSIGTSVFNGCSALEQAGLPQGLTEIPEQMFRSCTSLAEVSIPETVTSIGSGAFMWSGLKVINIPAAVTEIGSSAFDYCKSLEKAVMKDTVQTIGESVFRGCEKLQEIQFSATLREIPDNAFQGCSMLESISLPGGITKIGTNAFRGCSGLSEITVPEGVIEIGTNAFSGCTGLKSAVIHKGIKAISERTFEGCTNLDKAELPEGLTEIGTYAFFNCSGLSEINIPSSVTRIAERAFYNCGYLNGIVLPEGLSVIEKNAFWNCSCLTSINIPSSVTAIGATAFGRCTVLERMDFYGDAPEIGEGAFLSVTMTAYYPAGNETYTSSVKQNYKGTVTWKEREEEELILLETISLDMTSVSLLTNETCDLAVTFKPDNASNKEVTWSSSDESVASVSNGTVTAVGAGTAEITVTTADGNKTAKCTVTVTDPAKPEVTDVFTYENGYRTTLKDYAEMEKNMPVYFEANTGSRLFYKINDGEYRESTGYCFEGGEVILTIKAVNDQGEESEEYVLKIEEKNNSWEYEPGDVIPEDAETAGETIPEGLWVTDLEESVKYTGKAIKLTGFRVYNYKTLLKSGTDYTVSYKDNKNAGTAYLVIKGKGNYSGTVELPFTIEPVDLSETTAKNIQLKNSGAEQVIKPAVKWGSKTLKKDIDYTVSEITDTAFWTNGGEQTITITGKGNYAGTKEITVYIPKAEEVLMSKASIKLSAKTVEYGEKPEVTVTYKQLPVDAKAYEVIYPEDQAGKAALIVKGTGETDENLGVAFNGEKSLSYTIKGTALSKKTVTVEGNTSAVYTGKYQESELKLKDLEGNELEKDKDYTVIQARGLKAGKYTAVFTGKGAYSGTYKVTWTITSNPEIILIPVADQAYATGGATPEVIVRDAVSTNILVKGTDYTVKYTNNKKIGTATVKVTGKGNYKGATDEGTFDIHAQDLSALNVSAKDVNFTNKKNKYKSTPVVTDINGKKVAAKEYTVTYTYADGRPIGANDIPEAGTVIRVTVTGKGTNYAGTKNTEYRVIEKTGNISDTKVYEAEVMGYHAYTGTPVQPGAEEIELRDKAGNRYYDFEVVSYGANNKKGTGTVVIRGINTLGGTRTVKFTIQTSEMRKITPVRKLTEQTMES